MHVQFISFSFIVVFAVKLGNYDICIARSVDKRIHHNICILFVQLHILRNKWVRAKHIIWGLIRKFLDIVYFFVSDNRIYLLFSAGTCEVGPSHLVQHTQLLHCCWKLLLVSSVQKSANGAFRVPDLWNIWGSGEHVLSLFTRNFCRDKAG
jgi:hypothetical protein